MHTFILRRINILAIIMSIAGILFFTLLNSSNTSAQSETPFPDVLPENENIVSITYLHDENIFRGNDEGLFLPKTGLNRAEFATVLSRLSGANPSVENYNNCFPDVNKEWYAASVCLAKEQGWIFGFSAGELAGKFGPDQPVQDIEVLTMLSRLLNWDVAESEVWYEPALNYAQDHNIYDLEEVITDITREIMAEVIFRMLAVVSLENELYTEELDDAVYENEFYNIVDVELDDYTGNYYIEAIDAPGYGTNGTNQLVCDLPGSICTPTIEHFFLNEAIQINDYLVTFEDISDFAVTMSVDDELFFLEPLESITFDDFILTVIDFNPITNDVQLYVLPYTYRDTLYDDTIISELFSVEFSSEEEQISGEIVMLEGALQGEAYTDIDTDCVMDQIYDMFIIVTLNDFNTGELLGQQNYEVITETSTFILDPQQCLGGGSTDPIPELGVDIPKEEGHVFYGGQDLEANLFDGDPGEPEIKRPDTPYFDPLGSTYFEFEIINTGEDIQSVQVILFDPVVDDWFFAYDQEFASSELDKFASLEGPNTSIYSLTADAIDFGENIGTPDDIDPEAGYFILIETVSGTQYLVTSSGIQKIPAELTLFDTLSTEQANGIALASALCNCDTDTIDVLDQLITAFDTQGVSLTEENITYSHETGSFFNSEVTRSFLETMSCGETSETYFRIGEDFEVLPTHEELQSRFDNLGIPQQGAKYLMPISMFSFCDSDWECTCWLSAELINVETGVIEDAYFENGPCDTMSDGIKDMLESFEANMGKNFQPEDPKYYTL